MEEIKEDDSMDDDIIPLEKAMRMLTCSRNTFMSLVKNEGLRAPFKYKDSKTSKLFHRKSWVRDFLKKKQQAKSSQDETTYSFHAIVKK